MLLMVIKSQPQIWGHEGGTASGNHNTGALIYIYKILSKFRIKSLGSITISGIIVSRNIDLFEDVDNIWSTHILMGLHS